MNAEELKPCPFCGGKLFLYNRGGGELTSANLCKVACPADCFTMPPRADVWFTSRAQAITAANKRTADKDIERRTREAIRDKILETESKANAFYGSKAFAKAAEIAMTAQATAEPKSSSGGCKD